MALYQPIIESLAIETHKFIHGLSPTINRPSTYSLITHQELYSRNPMVQKPFLVVWNLFWFRKFGQ